MGTGKKDRKTAISRGIKGEKEKYKVENLLDGTHNERGVEESV